MALSWRLAMSLVCVWGIASVAQAQTKWFDDLAPARAEAQRVNRPILCHFYGDWCVPCKKMEATVLNQEKVLQQLGTTVIGVKIDVDKHPDLVKRFGISKFPTDLFIEPSGAQLMESEGMHPIDEYIGMMQRAATRYADLVAKRSKPANTEVQPVTAQITPVMDGFCCVTLWKNRKWEKGSEQFKADYKGQTYYFTNVDCVKEFTQNPERYVPRFLGCDPVIVWETDRAVPGLTQFGAYYDNELYLFVNDENRKAFKASPDKFIKTRVVLSTEQIEAATR